MGKELGSWIEEKGLGPEDLDEIVHDAAAAMASNSNNEGLRGQIEFLRIIAGWSDEDIKQALEAN